LHRFLQAGVKSSDSTAVQQLAMQQFLSERKVKVGDLLDGVVTSLQSCGTFIDVGNGAQALLPFSQITGMHLKYLMHMDALSVRELQCRNQACEACRYSEARKIASCACHEAQQLRHSGLGSFCMQQRDSTG
jgi:hypothetical protein